MVTQRAAKQKQAWPSSTCYYVPLYLLMHYKTLSYELLFKPPKITTGATLLAHIPTTSLLS
eukprot:1717499-Amphidinium_carterae.1